MKKIASGVIFLIALSLSVFANDPVPPPPCIDGHTPAGRTCSRSAPTNIDTETKSEKTDDIFSIISHWLGTLF